MTTNNHSARRSRIVSIARSRAADLIGGQDPNEAVVGSFTDNLESWPPRYMNVVTAGVGAMLRSVLDHCRAGRRHATRLLETYVLAEQEFVEIPANCDSEYSPNGSAAHVDAFVGRIVELANAKRRLWKERSSPLDLRTIDESEGRFVFLGPRGAGKTFFLNYVVSTRAEELEKHKVCWVRINLARIFRTGSLTSRLAYQTAYLVYSKYIQDPNRPNVSRETLDAWLQQSNPVLDRTAFFERLSGLRELPKHLGDPLPGSETSPPKDFVAPSAFSLADVGILKSFMMDKGYAFFYVFDGLDTIEPTTQMREMWRQWLEQCLQAWYDLGRLDTSLVTMRSESWEQVKAKFDSNATNTSRPRIFRLAAVDPNLVFLRRLEYAPKAFASRNVAVSPAVISGWGNALLRYAATGLTSESRIRSLRDAIEDEDLRSQICRDAENVLSRLSGVLQQDMRVLLRSLATLSSQMLSDVFQRAEFGVGIPKRHAKAPSSEATLQTQAQTSDVEVEDEDLVHAWVDDPSHDQRQPRRTFRADTTPNWTTPVANWFAQLPTGSSIEISSEPIPEWHAFCIRQRHRAMEVLTLGAYDFHATPFRYAWNGAGLEVHYGTHFDRSSGILPNLWTSAFALPLGTGGAAALPFAKVLTLVSLRERRAKHRLLTDSDAIKATLLAWGLSEATIEATLHELSYVGMMSRRKAQNGREVIDLSEGGVFALEVVLKNHNYLLSIVDSIGLPDAVADLCQDTTSCTPVRRLTLRLWNAVVFSEYLRLCWSRIRTAVTDVQVASAIDRLLDETQASIDACVGRVGVAHYLSRSSDEWSPFHRVLLGEADVS